MGEFFASVNGQRISRASLLVPEIGVWSIEGELSEVVPLAGRVSIVVGDLTLSGTIDKDRTGKRADRTYFRAVGGGGGWRSPVTARPWRNDGGVRLADVATVTGTELGEVVQVDDPEIQAATLGAYWDRLGGMVGSAVLGQLLEGRSARWWVDLEGVTRIGTRAPKDSTGRVQVVDQSSTGRWLIVAADELAAVLPGSSFTDPLVGASATVGDLEVLIGDASVRVRVWQEEGRGGRLASVLAAHVRQALPGLDLLSPRRYRVVAMSADRVDLQAYLPIGPGSIVPDTLAVSMSSAPGMKAQLAPGALVIVQFLDGLASEPRITAFSTPDDPSWRPISATLDATSEVNVGASAASVKLGQALAKVLRDGEAISITGTVTPGPSGIVKGLIRIDTALEFVPGPPGAGYSKVEA